MSEPRAVARSTDPVTSWQAALSVMNIRESQQAIYGALMKWGPLTDFEILNRADFKISPSGCRTRRKELVDQGLVEDTARRKRTPSGRRTIIWKAVPIYQYEARKQGRLLE